MASDSRYLCIAGAQGVENGAEWHFPPLRRPVHIGFQILAHLLDSVEQLRITCLDRDVASESTKQRPSFFKMRSGLFADSGVLDGDVSVPERGKRVVPRRKLSYLPQGAPCLFAHRSVVTAAPRRREHIQRRPMREIGGQPFGQAFDVRGRLKAIDGNPKQRQHRADAVDYEADAAHPTVTDIRRMPGRRFLLAPVKS